MKHNLLKLSTILFLVVIISFACEEDDPKPNDKEFEVIAPDSPQPKGNRTFGINISESSEGFESSFNIALEAGIEEIELNIPWNEIEPTQGNYQDPYGGVFLATSFYGANNIKVALSIALINTVKWELPDYLDKENCNTQEFITAFNNLVDWIIAKFPENVTLTSISIGNEIDLVLEGDSEWQKYTQFYEATSKYIQDNYPTIKVGVKTTIMGGVFGNELTKIQTINQFSDVVMLNYYPQNAHFQVYDPEIVNDHFNTITTNFAGKEIWLTEVGYQSGSNNCSSSETKQAQFYHHLFTAWDAHRDQIKLILIDWLHDQSPAVLSSFQDYYGNDPALVEYLSTLGLRNYDNTDKYAWPQVKAEANARGWD